MYRFGIKYGICFREISERGEIELLSYSPYFFLNLAQSIWVLYEAQFSSTKDLTIYSVRFPEEFLSQFGPISHSSDILSTSSLKYFPLQKRHTASSSPGVQPGKKLSQMIRLSGMIVYSSLDLSWSSCLAAIPYYATRHLETNNFLTLQQVT